MTGRLPTSDQLVRLRVPRKPPNAPLPGFTSTLLPAHRLIRRELPWGHWLPYNATSEQAAATPVEGSA